MKLPDVTPAQRRAVVLWVVSQLVAFGWVGKEYKQLAVSITATVVAVAWKFADAHIRHGRAVGGLVVPTQQTHTIREGSSITSTVIETRPLTPAPSTTTGGS